MRGLRHERWCGLALLIAITLSARGQDAKTSFSVQSWLEGPDRRDFPWEVRIDPPTLTYQQRFLLEVTAAVDGSVLRQKPYRHFTIIVKLADKDGHWLPGDDETDYAVTQPTGPIDQLRFYTGVYVRPGDYRIAVLMYDSAHQEGNVKHVTLHVPAPKHDPLPELARDFPAVEFPARIPGMSDAPIHDPGWSLGQGVEHLPIANSRPLRIDLVLDVSEVDAVPWADGSVRRGAIAEAQYQGNLTTTLAAGSVLSHLQPARGCVHVSALDMTRTQILLDRRDPASVDWAKLQLDLANAHHEQIDVDTLERQGQRSAFAAKFLTEVATGPGGCAGGPESADRVVILLSHPLLYPKHTLVTPVTTEQCPGCRFVYLRVTQFRVEYADPYKEMLNPLHPRMVHFLTPLEFRSVLSRLIVELKEQQARAFAH